MAEQGLTVSRSRVSEILAQQQAALITNLQQQIAELTAVNEALIGRLNEYSNNSASPNGKALGEGIINDPHEEPTSP